MDRDDFVFKKGRFLVQDTRKVDCTAQIKMREVLVFPEYKVSGSTKTIFAVSYLFNRTSYFGTILKRVWLDFRGYHPWYFWTPRVLLTKVDFNV